MTANSPTPLQSLLAVLDLEALGGDRFRGDSVNTHWRRVYGGQVVAQAMVAAFRTVEDRKAHSLHAYFVRMGDPKTPIDYAVTRIRDGRAFSTRNVVASQNGEAIFTMSASFHNGEPGLEHQMPMPAVPMPEQLLDEDALERLLKEKHSEEAAKLVSRLAAHRVPPHRCRAFPRSITPAVAAGCLDADFRSRARRSCPASGADRLHVGLFADRHGARRTWPHHHGPLAAGGQHRSRALVPPAGPRGRLAALQPGQPVDVGRAGSSAAGSSFRAMARSSPRRCRKACSASARLKRRSPVDQRLGTVRANWACIGEALAPAQRSAQKNLYDTASYIDPPTWHGA